MLFILLSFINQKTVVKTIEVGLIMALQQKYKETYGVTVIAEYN